jgi:hypothetical protein
MTLYILDTDHLSLYGRNHLVLIERLKVESINWEFYPNWTKLKRWLKLENLASS